MSRRKRVKARERRRNTRYHRGQTLGLTALRVVVGGLFVGHGAQKLFGVLDGPGLEATGQGFEQMGMKPGRHMAAAAGATELAGGSLMALGAATPLASAMLTGVMATAIEKVHRRNGLWNANGGFEYNAVLIASVFALADAGPGRLSVDHLRGHQRRGIFWALAALGAGVGGSLLLQRASEQYADQIASAIPFGASGNEAQDGTSGEAPSGGNESPGGRGRGSAEHDGRGSPSSPARSTGEGS